MAEATDNTLTPEEIRAARNLYQETFKGFTELWTAASMVDACRSGKVPESVVDRDDLTKMLIGRALRTGTDAMESLTDLGCLRCKNEHSSKDLVDRIVAGALKQKGVQS